MRNPALLALLFFAPGMAVAEARCSDARIDLRWQDGSESLAVEVADTVGERAQGLMFREALDPAAGMLFVYETPKRASFWMKNTLIPLDMIFADETGRVTVVQSDAIPQDLTPIDGGEGVMYVLEINGGLAKRIGIAAGAEMRFDLIDPSKALWNCAD